MNAAEGFRGRFFRLTFLNILANLTVPLVGLVDTFMLGHLADIRFLAGVALASIIFDYVYWSFGFLRMGTTGTAAQAFGAGDRAEVYRVLYRSLVLAAMLGVALLVLQTFIRDAAFWILSGRSGVESAGRDYFDARIWGAPAAFANFAFLGWYLGRAESRHALAMTAAGNVANIALNYVFIVRLGLAARGAGLASMLSQYVSLGVAVVIFASLASPVPWRWNEVWHRERLTTLLRLNLDILVRTFCLETAFAVFLNFSSVLGTTVLAANAILMRLIYMAAYLIDGAAFATESLAGILRGRDDREAFGRLVRLARITGLVFAATFLAGFLPLERTWYALLTSHEEVIREATRYGPWLLPVLVSGAVAYVYDGVFLGITAGRTLRNAMLLSLLAVFLPAAIIARWTGSAHGLWLAFTLFTLARAATLHVALRGEAAARVK